MFSEQSLRENSEFNTLGLKSSNLSYFDICIYYFLILFAQCLTSLIVFQMASKFL